MVTEYLKLSPMTVFGVFLVTLGHGIEIFEDGSVDWLLSSATLVLLYAVAITNDFNTRTTIELTKELENSSAQLTFLMETQQETIDGYHKAIRTQVETIADLKAHNADLKAKLDSLLQSKGH